MPAKIQKIGHAPDYLLIILVAVLVGFGLIMLTSASSNLGKTKFDDSYFYLKHQLLSGLLPGIAVFLTAYFFRYQHYKRFALLCIIAGIVLLALVYSPLGVRANHAQRWLAIGGFGFQPAEIMKIFLVLYLAAWLSNPAARRQEKFSEGGIPMLIIFGIVTGLIFFQPATTIALILAAASGAMYFASGANFRILFMLGILAVITFGLAVFVGKGHRLDRILTFLNPEQNVATSGFHINQALTTLGSGGLFGVGLGKSTVKESLPARIDDSIFAVIAGELGFIGGATLIAIFVVLVLRMLTIAKKVRDKFGWLICVGFASIIFAQSVINIAANTGLFPLTGVPLPFISYGGTALVVFLGMSGIVANISRYT